MNKLLQILKDIGIVFAYDHFAEGEAPAPPFVCYLLPSADNFAADGKAYFKKNNVHIELYTDKKDPVAEKTVEAALSGLNWDKNETFIQSEELFQVVYTIFER